MRRLRVRNAFSFEAANPSIEEGKARRSLSLGSWWGGLAAPPGFDPVTWQIADHSPGSPYEILGTAVQSVSNHYGSHIRFATERVAGFDIGQRHPRCLVSRNSHVVHALDSLSELPPPRDEGATLLRRRRPTVPIAAMNRGTSKPELTYRRGPPKSLRTRKNVENAGCLAERNVTRGDLARPGGLVTMSVRATVGRSEPSAFGERRMVDCSHWLS